MDVRFKDPKLDRLETDPTYNAGFSQAIVTAYRNRMQVIRAAPDERVFYSLKSLHFEKLKGNRSFQHSMRLNKQWRLIIEFEGVAPNKLVAVISIEDYHCNEAREVMIVEIMDRTPAEVFPPGEFIREEIEERGWSQVELAEILGRPPRLVSELIAGKRAITPETAKVLGEAFNTGAQFWMNLESSYRLAQVKQDGSNSVSRRAKLYEKAPVKEMMRRHWIQPTENIDVLEKSVLDFLHIKSLDEQPQLMPHAARKSTTYAQHSPAEQAWLFRTRQLAQVVAVKPFSEMGFASALARFKNMLRDPEDARLVPRVLADAGVRFLVVETLPQTRIDGACLWLNDKYPVIAISLRFDRIDGFWHTVLHECAHVKHRDGLEDGGLLDIDLVGESAETTEEKPMVEKRADEFAANFSISKSELDNFILRVRPLFSKTKIQGLAARLNVHPGIVVGQLQHRKAIPYSHSREMLAKVRHIVTEAALTDGFGSILATAV